MGGQRLLQIPVGEVCMYVRHRWFIQFAYESWLTPLSACEAAKELSKLARLAVAAGGFGRWDRNVHGSLQLTKAALVSSPARDLSHMLEE